MYGRPILFSATFITYLMSFNATKKFCFYLVSSFHVWSVKAIELETEVAGRTFGYSESSNPNPSRNYYAPESNNQKEIVFRFYEF